MQLQESSLIDSTYNKIAEELAINNYSIGTKLQPIRILAKKFNVSYLTAQRAVKAMQLQGALDARPGDGLYVVGTPKPLNCSVMELLAKKSDPDNKVSVAESRSARSIGVIMPFWLSSRGGAAIYELVKGMVSESDKYHWPVELIHNADNESELPEFVGKIHRRNLGGIVWLQPTTWHKMNLMRLCDLGYEVVVTGREFRDIPVKCVKFDHQDMARKVVEFFKSRNITNVGMLTGPIDGYIVDPYSVDIVDALRCELEKNGLKLPYENICQAYLSHRHELIVEDFLRNTPNLQGLVCLHELLMPAVEKLDKEGVFGTGKQVPLLDVSGIFNRFAHNMQGIEMVGVAWPLENMGKAVIRPFERKWLQKEPFNNIDLCVEILAGGVKL